MRFSIGIHQLGCLITLVVLSAVSSYAQAKTTKPLSGIYLQAFYASHDQPFVQDHFNSVHEIGGAFGGYGFATGYNYIDRGIGIALGLNFSSCKAADLTDLRGADYVTFKDVRHSLLLVDFGLLLPLADRQIVLSGMFNLGMAISSYNYHNPNNALFASFPGMTLPMLGVQDPDGPNTEVFFRGGGSLGAREFITEQFALLAEYRTVWAKTTTPADYAGSGPGVTYYTVDNSKGVGFYTDVISLGVSYTFSFHSD